MTCNFRLKTLLPSSFLAVIVLVTFASASQAAEKITYEKHVKPIFQQKCFSCHNSTKKQGGLDLTNYTALTEGGGSGEAVDPGSAEDSYLWMLITHESEPFMPPKSDKLPKEMLSVIKAWIDGGALENAGSKIKMKKKSKVAFGLKGSATEKPAGPPPMPRRLGLEPVVSTSRAGAVLDIATSPWAPLVAIAGQKQVVLYNTQTLQPLGSLPFPYGTPYVLKFSRNGSLLLAAGGQGAASGKVIVWNIKTGEKVIDVGNEMDAILAADISSDQTMIAVGGSQRVVRIYSTADGSLLQEIKKKHTDWIQSISFSPDSVLLASGDRSAGLFVWEAYTAREYLVLRGHKGNVKDLSWRLDSNVLASASEDSTIKLWEMNNGGQIKNWTAHPGGVLSVEYARDGRIVSCGRDRIAKLWDGSGKQIHAFPAFGDIALEANICDETNRVIAGDWNGVIHVWNAVDGKPVGDLTSNPPVLATRLKAAEGQIAPKTTQVNNLTPVAQTDQKSAEQMNLKMTDANKKLAESQKQVNDSLAKVKQSQELVTKQTATHKSATDSVTKLTQELAKLQENLKKEEAAAKAKTELAVKTDAMVKAKTAELAKTTTASQSKKTEAETSEANLKIKSAELVKAEAAVKAKNDEIKNSETVIKTKTDEVAKADVAAKAKPEDKAIAEAHNKLLTELSTMKNNLVKVQNEAKVIIDATNIIKAETNNLMAAVKKQREEEKVLLQTIVKLKAEEKTLAATFAKLKAEEKTLIDSVAKTKAGTEAKKGELTKSQQVQTQVKAELDKFAKQLNDFNVNHKNLEAGLVTAKKQVADLQPVVKAANDKSAQSANSLKQAQQALTSSQQQVARWKNEIAYQAKFNIFIGKRKQFDTLTLAMDMAEAELNAAKGEVTKSQQMLEQTKKNHAASVAGVAASKKQVVDFQNQHAQLVQQKQKLEQAIPVLKESQAKLNEAFEKSGKDPEIGKSVEQFKVVVDKKSSDLVNVNKAIPEKDAAIKKGQAAIVTAEKKVVDALKAIEVAQGVVNTKTQAVKPFEEKLAAAKKQNDAGKADLEQARVAIDPPKPVPAKSPAKPPAKAPAKKG